MRFFSIALVSFLILSSCVSKKKYLALEQEKGELTNELTKTRVEKEDLEHKFAVIEARVDQYNSKINSLTENVEGLKLENDTKIGVSADGADWIRLSLNNSIKAANASFGEAVHATLLKLGSKSTEHDAALLVHDGGIIDLENRLMICVSFSTACRTSTLLWSSRGLKQLNV